GAKEVRQRRWGHWQVDWHAGHAAEMSGRVQCSFQLANVATQLVGEMVQHVFRGDRLAEAKRFRLKNCEPRLSVRRGQAPHGTAEQAVGQFRPELVGPAWVTGARGPSGANAPRT